MRTVETLKTGRFKVRFRHAGKQSSETFDTRREAQRFAKWLDALGTQGALDQLYESEQDATVPTLSEVAAEYIEHRPKASDGTRLNYERLWARTWGPLVGHLPANRLDEDDLARAAIALGKRYSHKSLLNQQGLLSGVVARAVKRGYLEENIARAMKLPDGVHGDGAEMRIITPDEFDTVASKVSEHYRPFVRFLYATGARFGEAVVLQVRDVQLPYIHIKRALKWSPDNNRVVGAPKTKHGNRTIAITSEIHEEIRALTAGKPRDALVFTAPRGGMILHRTFWSRAWLPSVSHLEPRPRIHDIRHSHVSWLLAQGIPIHVVQKRLGHHSIQVTVDMYSHLLPDAQLLAAEAAGLAFRSREDRRQIDP